MKKIVTFIVMFLMGLSMKAQAGAKIEFKEQEIDYGTVSKATDNGVRFFEFTNTGDAPLMIKSVQATTGCAIPSYPKEAILPGKSGKIEVKYNMSSGPIRKSIIVESNAVNSEEGLISLKIKGLVN